MLRVRRHGDVVSPYPDMETIIAAVDHVSDLLASVVPVLPICIDATYVSDVLTRTMRMGLGYAGNLIRNHGMFSVA